MSRDTSACKKILKLQNLTTTNNCLKIKCDTTAHYEVESHQFSLNKFIQLLAYNIITLIALVIQYVQNNIFTYTRQVLKLSYINIWEQKYISTSTPPGYILEGKY